MGPIDYLILAVVAVIIGGAAIYIYRAKKSGKKCIGCPSAAKCGGNCHQCSCGCGNQQK